MVVRTKHTHLTEGKVAVILQVVSKVVRHVLPSHLCQPLAKKIIRNAELAGSQVDCTARVLPQNTRLSWTLAH